MRYSITGRGHDVEIRLRETGDRAPQLLASLQECREGSCGCPTDQYDRLADMAIEVDADEVALRLRPRDGERLDVGKLQACLDYTVAEAQESGN